MRIKLWSLITLSFVILTGCSDRDDPKAKREAEFNKLLDITNNSVDIDDYSVFAMGGLSITNKTAINWDGVQVNLNPPINTQVPDDIIGLAKSLKDTFLADSGHIDGFFAPATKNRYYGPIAKGDSEEISWGKFIHNMTGEKFSTSRYQPRSVIITFIATYQGKQMEKKEMFVREPDGTWHLFNTDPNHLVCLYNNTSLSLPLMYRWENDENWSELEINPSESYWFSNSEVPTFLVKFDSNLTQGYQESGYRLNTKKSYKNNCAMAKKYKFKREGNDVSLYNG
jgi:hypothetical protein